MAIFLTIFSLMFFYTTHNFFMTVINPLQLNIYFKVAIYIALFLLGQSFWILTIMISRTEDKTVSFILYFIVCILIYMFFYYLIANITKIFYRELNLQLYSLVFLGISISLFAFGYFNKFFVRTTKYNLKSDKNISLKIAFISDIHMGDLGMKERILKKVVSKINDLNPDFILIGGDIIENINNYKKASYSEILKGFRAKYGTYAVFGNHEYYGKDPYYVASLLKESNIETLIDTSINIGGIELIGRHDIVIGRKNLSNIISQNDNFKLLMDHNPKAFDEAVKNGIDLQLSGHTHNGQFFPFNLIVKFFYEKAYGLLKKENSILITSSGLSTWGPPIKILSKPEIVFIEINDVK